MKPEREALAKRISEAEERLDDARKRLPAHTIRPHQLQALEELEDELLDLKRQLDNLEEEN